MDQVEVMDAPAESTALVVLPTGEALMRGAGSSELAVGLERIAELEAQIKDAATAVGNELLRRMDATLAWSGKAWTFRVGDREYALKAPSPDAGTTAYNADTLAEGLAPLVEDGTLLQAAVDAVLIRTVTASVVGEHCESFKKAAARYGADVADNTKVSQRGVNALEKHPDERVAAAIEAAKTVTPSGNRKVKLDVKQKGGT